MPNPPFRLLSSAQRSKIAADTPRLTLRRRGVDHGTVVPADDVDPAAPPGTVDPATAWREGRPVFLPGMVGVGVERFADEIADSLEMFDRLRDGARFLDEVEQRMWDAEDFFYNSSSYDIDDQREIEKLFIDVPADGPGKYHAREITAKLNWIADDERDLSLRIRFSFGHEATRDWLEPDHRALWSDRFAERVFPESAAVTAEPAVIAVLDELTTAPWRLSERIVYNNAPGGGAVFHHDADPGQRGVVFAQLAGNTIWLALPKRDLAAAIVEAEPAFGDIETVSQALDAEPGRELWELLNATPEFSARLAERGALFVMTPGDVLLLPSHDPDNCVWHSVFGSGDAPSLAHSDGIFDALDQGI